MTKDCKELFNHKFENLDEMNQFLKVAVLSILCNLNYENSPTYFMRPE